MRNLAVKMFIGVAITTIVMFGADNSIGTWKRNTAQSKSTPPNANPIKSLTTVKEATADGIKVTSTGERQDGTPVNSSYTAKYDGKEYPVTGAPWDTISIKQIDAVTFTSETKKTGGKYHATSRTIISKDGKTMTITSEGTDAEGRPMSNKLVYDKQ